MQVASDAQDGDDGEVVSIWKVQEDDGSERSDTLRIALLLRIITSTLP